MKTNTSIQIGKRIKHFRELAGLTQLQLSEKIPCESSTLAHYETGKNLVSMTKLIRISEILGVELYQFFILNTYGVDTDKVEKLNKILKNASNLQLNLILHIIESILDVTSLDCRLGKFQEKL